MEIQKLYEDADTVVVNKPVDVVVNRAASVSEHTIQDWVETNYPDSFVGVDDKLFLERSGICHRLDKETSGCLMIAKNPKALRYYLSLFKDRQIIKEYVALVHGRVDPAEGDVILPLRRNIFDRDKFQVHFEGKRAITGWKVLQRFVYPGHEHWKDSLTYLRVSLKTGRTHQIRVHLSFLGWPIFSDFRYMNRKFGAQDRKYLSHHFLHAAYLSFENSAGEVVTVEAPLPKDCVDFLDGLSRES